MRVLTVSQINFFLKSLIEGDGRLTDVYVAGEISNFTDHYRSGHLYFSLKDEKSVLKAVMFASAARRLRFRPGDGMRVIVRGRVSVYEPSGQYQFYVEEMQPDGLGALSLAFEQMKAKLSKEGLFSEEFKKPIPRFPARIGIITSPTGAAVRDMLNILGRRWPAAELIFCPVLVQGEGAPAQLTAAVEEMNRKRCADVILKDYHPLNLFVYANAESKIQRCIDRAPEGEHLSRNDIARRMKQVDKNRAQYRQMFADSKWGAKETYHLCVNTSGHQIKDLIPGLAAFVRCWYGEK